MEWLDLVDDNDVVIGKVERDQLDGKKSKYGRVVNVFIYITHIR